MQLDTLAASATVSLRPWALSQGGPLQIDSDAPRTLTEALKRTAATYPNKGIHFIQRDGTESHVNYAALFETASRVLNGLQSRGGAPGSKVILQLDRLEDHYAAFWGCLLAGMVPVTVAIAPTYRERNGIVDKLHNTWQLLEHPSILTTTRLVRELNGLESICGMSGLEVWCVEDLISDGPSENAHEARPGDVAFIQLSSGSTGVPKCIQETHQGVIAHIHSSAAFNGYAPSDVTLNWLPVDHVVPLLTFHVKDTYLGCEQVHIPTDFVLAEPLKWLDLLEQYGATHTWAPNFGFKLVSDRLSRTTGKTWNLSRVQYFMNAGEQVTMPVVREFLKAVAPFGVREAAMQPAFGMAEVCTCMTYANQFTLQSGARRFLKSSLDRTLRLADDGDDAVAAEFISLGKVAPGVSIRIADADNHVVEERVIGRLQIKGPVVTPGYFRNDSANHDAFVGDGWFNSGDLGFIDGGELFLSGREKEMIIIRGAKFYCYEVEDIVNTVLGVEPTYVAAVGINDPQTGTEKLAIFFAPAGITDDRSVAAAVRRRVTARLGIAPAYVVPLSRERFPKTTSGKIQRTRLKKALESGELREHASELGETSQGSDVPKNSAEKRLADIWKQVLEVSIPGRTTNLFELGCDSLKAMQIVSRIREEWKVEMPIAAMFSDACTIDGMASWIAEHAGAKADLPPGISPAPRTRRMPLSYSQLRLWLAEQIDPGTTLYHICRTVQLKGTLDFQALEKALREIVSRHEILRTVYRLEDIPVQEVRDDFDLVLSRCDLAQVPPAERPGTADKLISLEMSAPFDLSTGPMIRARLIRLAPDEHVLAVVFHQIVTDAWSLKIFFRELRELYAAFARGAENPLPPLPVQYADYSTWQQRWYSVATLEPQLHYWRTRFSTPLPRLALDSRSGNAGRPDETVALEFHRCADLESGHAGFVQKLELAAPLLGIVRAFCATEGVTVHMVLLAAYQILLAAKSGEREIVVGSPESGRHRTETEALLGCFVNMMLLRSKLRPDESFRTLVRKVRQNVLEACAHADVPFEQVMQVIPDHEFRDRPFNAWFGPIDSLEQFEMDGLRAQVQAVFPPDAQFDLSCFLAEQADAITCFFECKQVVLNQEELQQVVRSYDRLLHTCLSAPDSPLADIFHGATARSIER